VHLMSHIYFGVILVGDPNGAPATDVLQCQVAEP
jgi:hypothetical protein